MNRRITLRSSLLQEARKASLVEVSQADGLVSKMVEGAPAETAGGASTPNTHREIVLGSPAARPSGSQFQSHAEGSRKRRAGRSEEDEESRRSRKKKKASKASKAAVEVRTEPPSSGGRVAGIEASGKWFSKISCGTDFPRLGEMSRRQEYESCAAAGTQFIAQMNRMVATYEADLKDAAESREQFEQSLSTYAGIEASLLDRVAGLEAEKKEVQDRAEVYERKYDEQYAELLKLRDQVKAMKEAESNLEAELKRKVLVELEEADAARRAECLRILGELRGDTTTRLLHLGQAENSLQLVEDLLSTEPPSLQDEKATLKVMVAKYAGSDAAFDKALDDLELLIGPNVPVPRVEHMTNPNSSEKTKSITAAEGDEEVEDGTTGVDTVEKGADAAVEPEKEVEAAVEPEKEVEPERTIAEDEAGGGSQNTVEI